MAAQVEGRAYLSSFVGALLKRLSSLDVNSIPGRKPDQELPQRFKTSLHAVRLMLDDAEQKQIKDQEVKKWLVDLQDAVYMADDLLDEVYAKAATATQRDTGNSSWSQYVDSELEDSEIAIANRMEHIVKTLESIVKLKDGLGLEKIAEGNMSWRIPSTSLLESSDIYGRDKDKEAIIKLLLDDTCDTKIPVIPIVGMGGVGKTTLAQLVYNDDELKGKFDRKAWVCVSDQFDIVTVTKTIIGEVTSSSCDCDENNLNLLQIDLKNELSGKKSLVVLDDVWNYHLNNWNILLKPFQYGSKGSKILLTTRNEKVASVIPTIPPYRLRLLSDEDCWLVFLKHAFLSTESREYSALEQIGWKIVKKCKGLPLAVETLGSLLRAKRDERDWNDILKSEIWEFSEDESRIIPALRISYHYLPSHLKRCFVYCSLYPKDYQFDKDELILLWMAEDILQPKRSKTLEEVGCLYFDELVARSFFQPSRNCDYYFVMHDLMHDLATFYAGEFYFKAENLGNAANIDIKSRHLSYIARGNYLIPKLLAACDKVKYTRTFLTIISGQGPHSFKNEDVIFLSQWKYLRVLSFRSFYLDSLPKSIGDLIHLRYLDLSYTCIVTLPESCSNLYNLQSLKLEGCSMLKILPKHMQDLVNLRHLNLGQTYLKEMPKGMSKLKHLQVLTYYIVGKNEENGIRELGALTHLHGSLHVRGLENVINSGEALEARMLDKKHINILYLSWSSNNRVADSQPERDKLDKLQPHRNLKELAIQYYMGTIFPDWLGHSSYHKMTRLNLHGCKNCCVLPSLGQLSSLNHLSISNFDSLENIGDEFYKNDGSCCCEAPFPSLETLEFSCMSHWQQWCSSRFDAFPQLKHLKIYGCPVLKRDLPNHLPALEILSIKDCQQLACSLPRAPAILELMIGDVDEIRLQELTCLKSLKIYNCSSVVSLPGACIPASLQKLSISGCKRLELSMQQPNEKLRELSLRDILDSLTPLPLNAFPNLETLHVSGCEAAKCIQLGDILEAMTCLQYLCIEKPASLEELAIIGCPKLEDMAGERLPASLKQLFIWSSFLLGERCKMKDPQIWPKISHIRNILVDGKRIS